MSTKSSEIKVLSFDVGIKNLSYCILTKNNEENEEYKIHNWGIINLTEDIIKEKNETDIDSEFIMNYKKMKIQELKNYMNKYGLETNKIRKVIIEIKMI